MDRKFIEWQVNLPTELRYDLKNMVHPIGQAHEAVLLWRCQHMLQTWYLISRLKLHRSNSDQDSRYLPSPTSAQQLLRSSSRATCVEISVSIIELQCNTHDAKRLGEMNTLVGSDWYFDGVFTMFDAAVTMVAALTKLPTHERLETAPVILDRAISVFERVMAEESGSMKDEIARMALGVMSVLRRERGWRRDMPGWGPSAPLTLSNPPPPTLPPTLYYGHSSSQDQQQQQWLESRDSNASQILPPPISNQRVQGSHITHEAGPSSYNLNTALPHLFELPPLPDYMFLEGWSNPYRSIDSVVRGPHHSDADSSAGRSGPSSTHSDGAGYPR